jgi:HTH-type transcriptional regulator/antitoxin HigA
MVSVRPIKNKKDYNAAISEVERLWGSDPNTPRGDKLDILLDLVEAYEARHYPIDPPYPLEAIKFRMEQMGYTRADLAELLGGQSRVTELFSGRRRLSLTMIRALHRDWGIPAESLIGSGESAPAE